jgi:CrcB protein
MIVLLVAIGGGAGAALRWVVTGSFGHSADGFPVGTTLVNVVGSFALGLIVGFDAGVDSFVQTDALTIGVLGGFTTFSTWMVDIHASDGPALSRKIVAVPLVLGLLAAGVGLALGAWLS